MNSGKQDHGKDHDHSGPGRGPRKPKYPPPPAKPKPEPPKKKKGCLSVILFAALVVWASSLVAGDVRDAVVKIGGCSGVCVSPEGHVLTAKHCRPGQRTMVQFLNGRHAVATLVYVSDEREGPVVLDCDGEGFPFAKIGESVPQQGEKVFSYGYPYMGPLRFLEGSISGGMSWGSGVRGNNVDTRAWSGWSGGPLFNARHQVIGLLSTSDFHSTSQWISFAAVRKAYDQIVKPAKGGAETLVDGNVPTLYVFSQPRCEPCEQFERDYRAGRFGKLNVVITSHADTARVRMVEQATGRRIPRSTPVFWIQGADRVQVGYSGSNKLCDFIIAVVKLPLEIIKAILGSLNGGRQPPVTPAPIAPVPPPVIPVAPKNDIELGEAEPSTPTDDLPKAPPLEAPPTPAPDSLVPRQSIENEMTIDWGDVHVVVLVAQFIEDVKGVKIPGVPTPVKNLIEQRKGRLLRRLAEATDGKVSVDIVTERISPERFSAVTAAAGVAVDKVYVLALVRKQDLGIKGLVVGKLEDVIGEFLKNKADQVPVDIVFDRVSHENYAAIRAALDTGESGAISSDGDGMDEDGETTLWALLAGLIAPLRELAKKLLKRGKD